MTSEPLLRPALGIDLGGTKIEALLIDHGGNGYGLTKTGLDLLKRLNDLQAFSNKWVAARAKAAATPTK